MDGSDSYDVREALVRLANLVKAYVTGNVEVERKRGLLGVRTTLIVRSEDGPWRMGHRTTQPPRFPN